MTVEANPTIAASGLPAGGSPIFAILRKVWRHSLGRIGIIVLGVFVVAALTAPWISPHGPATIDYEAILLPPSAQYWLGTDELGRDILSRIIYGATASLKVMGISIAIALVFGVAIGLITGYYGGWLDDLVMRIMDGLLAFPMLVLALAIVATLGPDLINAIIAIAIVNIPGFARLVRGQVLSLRDVEFVQAARAAGFSNARIIWRHIWPSVRGNVIVYASLKASTALITESALSFLGLGVQPPTPTWGSMLSVSMQYWDAWWMGVFPGAAIFLTVLALNFLGDALRDSLDSRLKG
ncbi:ABC transporter permease [Aquamicrobium sp. LC103]|uniref:ABC transporter permease n=1 Tax=Aquamicrobium sp. LC103 TaxID=1120658 RepID=UPI0009E4A77C|nr:ABC transporter permease [Aquamicrobium sp. LC103]TKT69873.1 ABC transporter permease [Aquamicrobium sp. LC103]